MYTVPFGAKSGTCMCEPEKKRHIQGEKGAPDPNPGNSQVANVSLDKLAIALKGCPEEPF